MKSSKVKIKTDYGTYECVFKADEKGYVVTCPTIEGVVTWGKNLAHARRMAKEAVELCVEVKVQANVGRGIAGRPVTDRKVLV